MTYRDPSWGVFTKLAAFIVLTGVIWYCLPSSVFFKPINMTIVKNSDGHWIAVSERNLPWGTVSGRTHAFIQVLGRVDGQECQWDTYNVFRPREKNVTYYDITDWAGPCLDFGPPTSVHFSRSIYLFGLIPLRSVDYSFTLNPEAAPVVREGGVTD